MRTTTKLTSAAAVVAGLGIGSVAGMVLGVPGLSGAAESGAVTVAHAGRGHVALGVAADTIGISEDDLRTALREDQTIAEVAEANGVDPQTVIDALVADATTRIDERVAAGDITEERATELEDGLADRMTALVNGDLDRRGGGPGRGFGRGFFDASDTLSEVLGISEDELRQALRDGQSIADIAEANGIDRQAVVDALVAEATERIESFIDGEIGPGAGD